MAIRTNRAHRLRTWSQEKPFLFLRQDALDKIIAKWIIDFEMGKEPPFAKAKLCQMSGIFGANYAIVGKVGLD